MSTGSSEQLERRVTVNTWLDDTIDALNLESWLCGWEVYRRWRYCAFYLVADSNRVDGDLNAFSAEKVELKNSRSP